MLLLNALQPINIQRKLNLNTSYVVIKRVLRTKKASRKTNLNTSYVVIKRTPCMIIDKYRCNLNTSYVVIKPERQLEMLEETSRFKYILCCY